MDPNCFFIISLSKSVTHNYLCSKFVKTQLFFWNKRSTRLLWPKNFSKRDQVEYLTVEYFESSWVILCQDSSNRDNWSWDCWLLWVHLELGELGTRVWPCSAWLVFFYNLKFFLFVFFQYFVYRLLDLCYLSPCTVLFLYIDLF